MRMSESQDFIFCSEEWQPFNAKDLFAARREDVRV